MRGTRKVQGCRKDSVLNPPQLIVRVSPNKYAPVCTVQPGTEMFVWSEEEHRIVPLPPHGVQ